MFTALRRRPQLPRLRALISDFRSNRRGNVAVIAALAMLPIESEPHALLWRRCCRHGGSRRAPGRGLGACAVGLASAAEREGAHEQGKYGGQATAVRP